VLARLGRLPPILGGIVVVAASGAARAQDDGPRVYQLTPDGAKNVTVFAVVKRSNDTPTGDDVVAGSKFDTNIVVFRYTQTFNLGGQSFAPFIILPTGQVSGVLGGNVKASSGGLGDAQIGATLGLIGSPALSPEAFARYKPSFRTALFGRVFFPTGDYSSARPVNLGSNRFAYQLGLTTSYAFGQSYADPSLTTIELLPTVSWYDDNTRPYGASQLSKAPFFTLEGHATHNLNRTFWFSADVFYRQGGETFSDGISNLNAVRGWAAGGTAAFRLSPLVTVALTYEHVVQYQAPGPMGWFFRTALIIPFR
jgi:hypothetical protein